MPPIADPAAAEAGHNTRPAGPHHLVARLREMRRTARARAEAHSHPQDVLLILADWAEEAAVEFRASEAPEPAEAFTQAAKALRDDAAAVTRREAPR